MAAPVLVPIVRQHAEQAAFLWTVYNNHLLNPEENPDMNEIGLERLVARLEAHLDGLRVAGEAGRTVAAALYEEYPEEGELFVLRMLAARDAIPVPELDLDKVRAYLRRNGGVVDAGGIGG